MQKILENHKLRLGLASFLAIVVLVTALVFVPPEADALPEGEEWPGFTGCFDSDGLNTFTWGYVQEWVNGNVVLYKADTCGGSTWVVERRCYLGSWYNQNTNCANGCYLGRCNP